MILLFFYWLFRLGISVAYELSRLSEEKQDELFEEYQTKENFSIVDVEAKKVEPEKRDFTDMTATQKADYAIEFLHTLSDEKANKQIYDFIVSALEF